jgi:2-methylcitrate dehydratase PrpD
MADLSVARRLARFVVGLSLDQVPRPIVEATSRLALDTVGNALAAAPEDFGRAALTAASDLGGKAESTLIGGTRKVSAANAALANGTLAHGLDFDDTREDAIVHTGCVAVTTALAVGEALDASGRAAVEAMLAGVEVFCRVGLAVPGQLHARHFHPTAVNGVFAATAAAGKLYGLSEDQLVRAFGIAGSQSAGIIEYLADGTWTKRLHAGWAAHAGVTAAVLARAGFTGPETVFEGAHGFYEAFAGGHDAAKLDGLLATLGRTWEIANLTLKPYPCGSIAQPYMDCAYRLHTERRIDPTRIAAVVCRTHPGPVPRLWEPLAAKHAPPNGYAAKFSLPYLLALIFVNGRAGLANFTDDAVHDDAVLRVTRLVTYELDPTIDYPRHFIGDVRVRLTDGTEIAARQDHPRGGPDDPMTTEEVETKFRGNAALTLGGARVDRVVRDFTDLAAAKRVAAVAETLAKEAS